MPVSDETLRILAAQRQALGRLLNGRGDDLVALWVRAWDEVSGEVEQAITAMMRAAAAGTPTWTQAQRFRRASKALTIVSRQLLAVADRTGAVLTADARRIVEGALRGQAVLLASELPPSALARLNRVDPRQVEQIIARTGEQITKAAYRLSAEATEVMRRELVRSVAVGDNPREAARRMLQAVQDGFNGGLTRALVISRTEMLDAHRRAAQAFRTANRDVIDGWRWMCDLSTRSCPACVGMHGTTHPADEPGPAGHQQCRCVAVPVTKSWQDLGFDIEEPPDRFPDADRWFDGLPEADRRELLGPSRYEAWQAGNYPRDQWATIRHAAGWRDSYVPSPAPVAP